MTTIGVVANGRVEWLRQIRAELASQVQALGMAGYGIRLRSSGAAGVRPGEIVVYLAPRRLAKAVPTLQPTVAEDRCLPVVEDLAEAKDLPAPVNEANAIAWSHGGAAAVVREALAMLLLRRRVRRVFVSYRRSESQLQANQLHELLTKRRYEVFLDTVTIQPAAQFQRTLLDWLTDADVLLALATPGLTDSPWVMAELQHARSQNVGLLVVRWPGVRGIFDSVDADQVIDLDPSDITRGKDWTPAAYTRVAARLDEIRTRVVMNRTRELMSLALDAADPSLRLRAVRGSVGDLTGRGLALRAFPFRPTPQALFDFALDRRHRRADALYALHHQASDQANAALAWLLAPRRPQRPHQVRLITSADQIRRGS